MTTHKKGRVFSGARPTGRQHLGNYLGAIQNYVALQDDYDCVYCIVDLHALTTVEDTVDLRQNTIEMALDFLAALRAEHQEQQRRELGRLEFARLLPTATPKE